MPGGQTEPLARRSAEAAQRAEGWMLEHLADESVVGSDLADPVRYYKWPLALCWRGRTEEAGALLDWIAERCLTEEGDLAAARSGFHREFHSYANLWLVWAAAEMGRSDLARRALGFLLPHRNPRTGGLLTNPTDASRPYEDPLSTSFLGVVACTLSRAEVARSAVDYLRALLESQPDPSRFWLRTLADGSLLTQVPPGAEPGTFVIELGGTATLGRPSGPSQTRAHCGLPAGPPCQAEFGEQNQCYYFLGAMCYFLARHLETFGDGEARGLAERVADLLEGAGPRALGTIWAAKVGPGCVALYRATGEERYLGLARPAIEAVLAGQAEGGCWLKGGKPWITVSAEQCAWLTEIGRLLEKGVEG